MDAIIARIKEIVLILNPSLSSDYNYLDLIIAEVVDRALIYTNRDQLVADYEEALEDLAEGEELESYIQVPIPSRLERVLAQVVIGVYKNSKNSVDVETNSITRVKDQGQEVQFGDSIASFLYSSSDTEIFSGSEKLLKRYLLPTIIENT